MVPGTIQQTPHIPKCNRLDKLPTNGLLLNCWFHEGGVKLGVNPHRSIEQSLQVVEIFAQEPTLGIFRLFAML